MVRPLRALAFLAFLALPAAGQSLNVPTADSSTAVTAFLPHQPAGGIPRKKAAARMSHRALTPKMSAAIQDRAQVMAGGLAGFKTLPDGPRLMTAEQLQPRHALPRAQAALLRRLAPPPPPPPPAVPHKAFSWIHIKGLQHLLNPKSLFNMALMEIQMHPENQAKTMSGWGLGLAHTTGLSGMVETGIYAATLPFQTMALRYAAKKTPPINRDCLAVDMLVQKGVISNAELSTLYSSWNGRWRFETLAGLKHEPVNPPAGQEQKALQIVTAESVKAGTSDMGFQQYLMNLPQYKDKVAQEVTELQKAGPGNELKELINAGVAHEIPTKDSGMKSSEYETKLYNGKVVPNAMQVIKSMAAVAAGMIPGVSEYRVGVLELQTLRDPTLTKTEKAFTTVRNFAGTVGMAMAFIMPFSSIVPFVVSEGADLTRRAWHARQAAVCAWEHCDGEDEPGYPQPPPAPAAALP